MSFVVVAALAVMTLVGLPLLAHLLRRGHADPIEFPPASLVPAVSPAAQQRRHLGDRTLFAVRALMIVSLAILGATPLVRCSRLSLDREQGASVALAVVIDDSMSMRAKLPGGKTRFSKAREAALELLESARDGDAIALVLAGRPARLALAASTNLGTARDAVESIKPTDRATDLQGALQLARSALRQLPHRDRRVVLLSDLAGDPVKGDGIPIWAPVEEVATPVANCGLVEAVGDGASVTVTVACSAVASARARRIELIEAREGGKSLASVALAERSGTQSLSLSVEGQPAKLDVRLTGSDSLEEDDRAPVAPRASTLQVGVLADPATASVITGGPTLLEQALGALGYGKAVRPLTVIPEDRREIDTLGALLIDDPGGLTPELRSALGDWVRRGGVAVGLLGPRVAEVKLGSTLEPLLQGPASWSETSVDGLASESVRWLGPEAPTLAFLGPRGRIEFADSDRPETRVIARWTDGKPFVLERRLGRGLVLTLGLPSAASQSDLPLRPGFLAFILYVLGEAEERQGPRRSPVGATWRFSENSTLRVSGPGKPSPMHDSSGIKVVPEHLGRYQIVRDGGEHERIVTLDAEEITLQPVPLEPASRVVGRGEAPLADVSDALALVLLLLFVGELALRIWRQRRATKTIGSAA